VKVEAPALPSDCNNDTKPLNLTHPKFVRPGTIEDQIGTVKVIAARVFSPPLIDYQATYIMLDQFKKDLTQSEFGGARPLVKEDTPFQSAYPRISAWIPTIRVGGDVWQPSTFRGGFIDILQISSIPVRDFLTREGLWDVSLKGKTILSLNTHDWHTSV
jgi:hypothetical protein